MSYEKRPRFEVTIFAEPGGHAARLLQTDRWCVSSTLHAAIEAEVAERVAEALRSQLPEDAPDEPGAWQGDGWPLSGVWNPEKRRWFNEFHVEVSRAHERVWLLAEALCHLCTEPEQLTMPMRARRCRLAWLAEARRYSEHGRAACARDARARADSLADLLIDSGEPL